MARRPPGRARGVFATSPRARAGVGARPRVDSLRNAGAMRCRIGLHPYKLECHDC